MSTNQSTSETSKLRFPSEKELQEKVYNHNLQKDKNEKILFEKQFIDFEKDAINPNVPFIINNLAKNGIDSYYFHRVHYPNCREQLENFIVRFGKIHPEIDLKINVFEFQNTLYKGCGAYYKW